MAVKKPLYGQKRTFRDPSTLRCKCGRWAVVKVIGKPWTCMQCRENG